MEELTPIECEFRPKGEFESVFGPSEDERKKLASYHGSMFFHSVPGFGRDRWVITAAINADFDKYLGEGMSEEEVVKSCIAHLNIPVGKRKKKLLYGNLELLYTKVPKSRKKKEESKPRFKILEDDGGTKYASVIMTTDIPKSKYFWGKGYKYTGRRRKASGKKK
tara:strand:- start:321 stop:815 length:495 start_codon:yes stop_codon:yes gene_type:complete